MERHVANTTPVSYRVISPLYGECGGVFRVRSVGTFILFVAFALVSVSRVAGHGINQAGDFTENFRSGVIDWDNDWDTDGGLDTYKSFYRVARLSSGYLAHDRQSYYSDSQHDYFNEQLAQVLRSPEDHGFWDSASGAWVGSLLWNEQEGWYASEPHHWRFSVELEEGLLMAMMLADNRRADPYLKSELQYIQGQLTADGVVSELMPFDGYIYEYGLILSALALGARYFAADDPAFAAAAFQDMKNVFRLIATNCSKPQQVSEGLAVELRGFVNAYYAALAFDDASLTGETKRYASKLSTAFTEAQNRNGTFDIQDGNYHVQKHLKSDIALMLAYGVTNDTSCVDAVKRNMDWVISNRWDQSEKCMGGLTWALDDSLNYYECHQAWFITAARYLELYASDYSFHSFLEQAFAFLTDDNFAGVDMYVHNAQTYNAFFAYRAISRDGTIQEEPFHKWKGAYEIGASLWALALVYDVQSEGYSLLATQVAREESNDWNKAIFSARDFGTGCMKFKWIAKFEDASRNGAYTGLFNDQHGDWRLLLSTTRGLSYRDAGGNEIMLVSRNRLLSGVPYTVTVDKRNEEAIMVTLEEDGVEIFQDAIDDMKAFDACYFGVFQNTGLAMPSKSIFIDLVQYSSEECWQTVVTPSASKLYSGYPNPFNGSICIEYDVVRRENVRLCIYDVAGRLIARLADGIVDPAHYLVYWDGTNGRGERAASGVYLCRMEAPGFERTQKVVLLR
ncbi:MAG: hypothetical protein PHD74_00755 [Candidatus Krumholzibacteria bacterium]|nr:hypothetical protein [Candidatus Krumholzibacteria bacterium]